VKWIKHWNHKKYFCCYRVRFNRRNIHASILKLIKYDEFVTSTLDSILLEQTEPSTFRLSSAYRYLIKSKFQTGLCSVETGWILKFQTSFRSAETGWIVNFQSSFCLRKSSSFRGVSVLETPSFTVETTLHLGRSISSAAAETAEIRVPATETLLKLQWLFTIPEGFRQDSNIGNSFSMQWYEF